MLGSLALNPACGENPCGFWDMIWARDACINYKFCVNPNDPTAILESQGLIAGSGTLLGNTAGETINNFAEAAFQDPVTGGVNWTVLGVTGIIAYFLLRR